jgi:hypothetical protein
MSKKKKLGWWNGSSATAVTISDFKLNYKVTVSKAAW